MISRLLVGDVEQRAEAARGRQQRQGGLHVHPHVAGPERGSRWCRPAVGRRTRRRRAAPRRPRSRPGRPGLRCPRRGSAANRRPGRVRRWRCGTRPHPPVRERSRNHSLPSVPPCRGVNRSNDAPGMGRAESCGSASNAERMADERVTGSPSVHNACGRCGRTRAQRVVLVTTLPSGLGRTARGTAVRPVRRSVRCRLQIDGARSTAAQRRRGQVDEARSTRPGTRGRTGWK